MSDWFVAHKDGLRQIHERLVERRSVGFGMIGGELYQNVMDTDATECLFTIEKIPNKPRILITVVDNGHGFHNLTDAWTMYAPSEKKSDPTKAGRFNLGEKAVLSFAYEASIHTTSGTVIFSEKGRENLPRRKRDIGTEFRAELACTDARYQQLLNYMDQIIVRPGLKLVVNGREIPHKEYLHRFEHQLPTEIGDDLRPTRRITPVEIYESGGEVSMLYELGIPVVETGDKWHVNILQKCPLNVDRDNVTPSYLRAVRVAVFNAMHNYIEPEDTQETWVNEAASDERCTGDAVETFRVKKYGEKSVAFDPSNPEANAEAVANNWVVIPSRGLTPGQRENLYRNNKLYTSTEAFPTAGRGAYSDDPNATPVEVVPEEKWSEGMRLIREYTQELGKRLMNKTISVRFVNCKPWHGGGQWAACYGRGHLLGSSSFDFNIFKLGRKWFDSGVTENVDKLIIHEFGHEYESNHLSEKYYDALASLGAKLKREALKDTEWFERFLR